MGSIGTCCCQSPCNCEDTPEDFVNLHFASTGGLHDVEFESPLWSRENNNTSIIDSFWPNPISTVPACDPKIRHGLVPARKFVDLVDEGTCCLGAYAWPTTRCRSIGKVQNVFQSERGIFSRREEWHYRDISGSCGTGWLDRGTVETDAEIDWSYSTLAFREVYGISLRACYVSVEGYANPKIRLTATVEYRDWFLGKTLRGNGETASFLTAFSGSPAFSRRFPGPFGFPGPCELQPASPPSTNIFCRPRASRLAVLSKDSIVECDTCPPPNRTMHEDADVFCTSFERMSRDLILDPKCSINGTHTFLSTVSPRGKYVMQSVGCCGTTIIINGCNYVPSWLCDPPPIGSNLPTYRWPTAGTVTNQFNANDDDLSFDLRRVTTTYLSGITIEDTSSGDGVPLPITAPECKSRSWKMLDYWSEPWTITIS